MTLVTCATATVQHVHPVTVKAVQLGVTVNATVELSMMIAASVVVTVVLAVRRMSTVQVTVEEQRWWIPVMSAVGTALLAPMVNSAPMVLSIVMVNVTELE